MKKSDIIGVWKLISFEIVFEDHEKILPYGKNPIGHLIYTENDYVAVQFMPSVRKKCLSDDYRSTTIEEKKEMADNCGGYTGQYEIQNNAIIHYPEVCIFPNFIKVPQIREYELADNRLTLKCSYVEKGSERRAQSRILWEKITPQFI